MQTAVVAELVELAKEQPQHASVPSAAAAARACAHEENGPAPACHSSTCMAGLLRVLTLISSRWEIGVLITLKAVSLFWFGHVVLGYAVDVSRLCLAVAFGFATQAYCNILNDITDIDIDRINHPERPLPSGLVSLSEAWCLLSVCGLVTGWAGWLLATCWSCYAALAIHVAMSTLYSMPGARLGRHWLSGPLTLVAADGAGIWFMIACSPLYLVPGLGLQTTSLVVLISCAHHLLVLPLKDVADVTGDADAGSSSLVMLVPAHVIQLLSVLGYTAPWFALYVVSKVLYPTTNPQVSTLSLTLQSVALFVGTIGIILVSLHVSSSKLLRSSQRLVVVAELLQECAFHVALAACATLIHFFLVQ